MISKTLFAISQNDQNPVHTGSLFDLNDGILHVVSVDGYRLAMRKEKINLMNQLKFVVPGKTLSEIVKLSLENHRRGDDDDQVGVHVSKETHLLLCRRLSGDLETVGGRIHQL